VVLGNGCACDKEQVIGGGINHPHCPDDTGPGKVVAPEGQAPCHRKVGFFEKKTKGKSPETRERRVQTGLSTNCQIMGVGDESLREHSIWIGWGLAYLVKESNLAETMKMGNKKTGKKSNYSAVGERIHNAYSGRVGTMTLQSCTLESARKSIISLVGELKKRCDLHSLDTRGKKRRDRIYSLTHTRRDKLRTRSAFPRGLNGRNLYSKSRGKKKKRSGNVSTCRFPHFGVKTF